MATLQRTLVNLEILTEDISLLSDAERGHSPHLRLLHGIRNVLEEVELHTLNETETGFQTLLKSSLFEDKFERKRMVNVYKKLVDYVITSWEATEKANVIIADSFDEGADKRLELLQVKAIKAKSQLKTVATAMGKTDYEKFTQIFGLTAQEWLWDNLRARF
jgi:glycerophosphoryl diester phosphodiesterase